MKTRLNMLLPQQLLGAGAALLLALSAVSGAVAAVGRTMDLAASRQNRVILGPAPDSYLSESVQTDDFNGDGKSDIIVGAPGYSRNIPYAGAAYLILGNADHPATTNLTSTAADLTLYGAVSNDAFGHAMTGGDVNGDGISDLIVSADRIAGERGEVYVFMGGPSLGTPAQVIDMADPSSLKPALTVRGAFLGGRLGRVLGSADINRDGLEDIIIGAYLASPGGRTEAGAVYVISGSRAYTSTVPTTIDLATTSAMLTIYGKAGVTAPAAPLRPLPMGPASLDDETKIAAEFGDRLGHAVSLADVNRDAIPDLITGSYGANPDGKVDAGEAYIFYGSATYTTTTPVTIDLALTPTAPNHTFTGIDAGDQASFTLVGGQLNPDGYADLLIGAYQSRGLGNAAAEVGEAYLVLGSSALPATASLTAAARTFYGFDGGDRLSRSLTMGDLNGDGQGDLVLGASRADPAGRSGAGAVYIIYSGAVGSGALHLDNNGAADVTLWGASAGTSICNDNVFNPGVDCSDELGFSAASGDVNGDGIADLLTGAVYANNNTNHDGLTETGAVYIIYGGDIGVNSKPTYLTTVYR